VEKTITVTQYKKNAIILSANTIEVGKDGGRITIVVKSNLDYTVQMPDVNWIQSVENTRGISSQTLYYDISPNETDDSREASIVYIDVESGTKENLTITQEAGKINTDDYTVINVVEPGTLEQLVGENKNKIMKLKLIGNLNDKDFSFLRSQGGYNNPEGRLANLDLSDVLVTQLPDSAFFQSIYLTTVLLPNTMKTMNSRIFSRCTALRNVVLPNNLQNIGFGAFSGCTNLSPITIPNSVTKIGGDAFSGCHSLTSITIPAGVTNIGLSAFSSCSNLLSVNIPNRVKTIEPGTFFDCRKLSAITIPNSITTINHVAFFGCSSLASITLPSSVISVGEDAFTSIQPKATIHSHATTPPSIRRGGYSQYVVYVPKGCVSSYKESAWGTYFTDFREE
jgi:hypothetical protein